MISLCHMKKPLKTNNFLDILDKLWRLVLLFSLIAVGYWIYHQFFNSSIVYLPPVETPPAFSVSYLVSANSPLEYFGRASGVDKDLDNIKSAGFTGIKVVFNLDQADLVQKDVVEHAAQKGLYSIGILNGHNAKPANRAFTEY